MRKQWIAGVSAAIISLCVTACGNTVQKEATDTDLVQEEVSAEETVTEDAVSALEIADDDIEVTEAEEEIMVKQGKTKDEVEKGSFQVGVSVHDPSIVETEGTYYIFGSHMEGAECTDLRNWKSFASGVNGDNPLFSNLFDEEMKAFQYVDKFTDGGYAVWAPDVIYNEVMEKWIMYFSTSHDYRTSVIHFATADDVKGPYEYQDALIYSGFSEKTLEKTNFSQIMGSDVDVKTYLTGNQYNNKKYPNCIDPCVFYDKDGRLWMVYGSWSGGIWLLEIDQQTGYPIHPETDEETDTDAYFGKHLIGGWHKSCEGPYLYYDKDQDMYYLLVSYGELTRTGGYQIRCYRSETVDGEYVDVVGNTFKSTDTHQNRGLKMIGNYSLPSLTTAYMAPGHCSVLQSQDGGLYLVHHTRFDKGTEYHEPRVRQMAYNEDGWPVAMPFATAGEVIGERTYKAEDVDGRWYFLNHGIEISGKIHEATETILMDSQVMMQDEEQTTGSYELTEDSFYMTVTFDGVAYRGVLVDMTDEAGNAVRCFSGAGDNNETLWGVMYL